MSNRHFHDVYVDDLGSVDPMANYFIPVWDSVFQSGIKPDNMLDIACGNGAFSVYAQRTIGAEMSGVDGSEYALSQAARRGYQQLKHLDDFNVDSLPWNDGCFDFCLCKDLLEHLVNPVRVMNEAFRLLRPGGHCLVHVPNHFPIYGRLKFLWTNEIDTFQYFPGARRWEFPHIRFFTYESLLDMTRLAGFRLRANLSYHFPALPAMGMVPFGKSVGRSLARRNPSQFAEAFTLLLERP